MLLSELRRRSLLRPLGSIFGSAVLLSLPLIVLLVDTLFVEGVEFLAPKTAESE